MSEGFIRLVKRTIRKHQMLSPGDLCLVAVSGGPDSMALAHLLWRLREDFGVRLALAHFNHGLRPAASQDEQVVVGFAKRLQLPLFLDRANGLERNKAGLEEAARQARYSFLERTRESVEAGRIALGHTADDQVETVLMNLFRGAGARGLGGMLPVRDDVFIRPLLDVRREQVDQYCRDEGLEPALDETNLDPRFTRNWLRLRLFPLLDDRFAGWRRALLRSARLAAQESQVLAEWVTEREEECILARDDHSLTLSKSSLTRMVPALRGALLRDCLAQVAGGPKDIGEAAVDASWALANSRSAYGIREVRKGLWIEKEYDHLRIFRSQGECADLDVPTWQEVPLPVPGRAFVPELGLTISAFERRGGQKGNDLCGVAKSVMASLDLSCVGGRLVVRPWHAGDRFCPSGVKGHKKLQDFFVDRKVSRKKRGRIPIVADEEGRIVWIVGYAVDERVMVRTETKDVVVLMADWPGECGGR